RGAWADLPSHAPSLPLDQPWPLPLLCEKPRWGPILGSPKVATRQVPKHSPPPTSAQGTWGCQSLPPTHPLEQEGERLANTRLPKDGKVGPLLFQPCSVGQGPPLHIPFGPSPSQSSLEGSLAETGVLAFPQGPQTQALKSGRAPTSLKASCGDSPASLKG
ncbi:hypothetical protein E2320_005713, partial [Naja naja]